MSDEVAFAFLSDIRKKFIQAYNDDNISTFHAYQLNEFNEILKSLMVIINILIELLQ